jgi:hypothetical protein
MQHKTFNCLDLMRQIRKQLFSDELSDMSVKEQIKFFESKCPGEKPAKRSGFLGFLRRG